MYEKGKVFYKYYLDLGNENVLYESEDPKNYIPFYTHIVEQRKDIDSSSALHRIEAHFKLMHVDVADIRFFSKSAFDRKYCLLPVDLLNSKMYTYPIKSRHLLAQ